MIEHPYFFITPDGIFHQADEGHINIAIDNKWLDDYDDPDAPEIDPNDYDTREEYKAALEYAQPYDEERALTHLFNKGYIRTRGIDNNLYVQGLASKLAKYQLLDEILKQTGITQRSVKITADDENHNPLFQDLSYRDYLMYNNKKKRGSDLAKLVASLKY